MNIANKRYKIANKYENIDMSNIPKYQLEYDLEDLGITVKPFYDKDTLVDILSVVINHIIQDKEGK